MKGDGSDLEPKTDHQEAHANAHERMIGEAALTHCGHDAKQIRRASGAVQQRDAIQQEAGRKGAKEKILHRRFARLQDLMSHAGQDVLRQGHDLQAEENDQEIATGRHQHGAQQSEEEQSVVLSQFQSFLSGVADRQQHGKQSHHQKDDLQEQGGHIHHNHAAK